MLAVDSGAAAEFARLSDLPDAAKIWREEYLPAYAQKYGVRVGDVNAVVRSSDVLDAARVRKMIDSIPDEEESLKLEAIGDADIEQLSDAHLEYAAERGQTWAADELVRRAEAENASGIDSDDVFSRLDFEGAKLPTPEAMAQKGGSLSEEMKAVYDSLPAALKKKYFIDANVKLDEVAESLGYETEAELISALSDAAGRVADGYKVGNEKRKTKNEERKPARQSDTEIRGNFVADLKSFREGKLPTQKILNLGNPSDVLKRVGIPDTPIVLRQSVIKKILNKHNIGYDLIEKLPEAINTPIAVF